MSHLFTALVIAYLRILALKASGFTALQIWAVAKFLQITFLLFIFQIWNTVLIST